MKKLFFSAFLMSANLFAHDLSVKYASSMKANDKKIIESVLGEVADLLPEKMKFNLPKDLEIKIATMTGHKVIPDDVCNKREIVEPFIYGSYNQYKNVLTINTPVIAELLIGKNNSKRINCQHKTVYDQAIATIVHELAHAYDFNNGRISNSLDYINRAGFKKGLLKTKNKNIQAMRSADIYELVNVAESFAINMEYFTMDPEFLCRKPSMFNYFKQLFNTDPYPTRTCKVNSTVMVSTAVSGFVPTEIDSNRVFRIDYLLASAGNGLQSGFGHSMFRIIICAPERFDPITNRVISATPFGKKCLEDRHFHLVVSYRANVEDSKLNYLKGMFGGYPSMLFILNFGDVLSEYNRDELRDLISYPLNLSTKEREEFLLKVKEEHWNYRGSYKFINNNCAVESYDLLKSALDRSQLNNQSSVSPNGVLEDLDKMNFLSIKSNDIETFKAKTDQIVLAYKAAYGYKLKNEKDNKASIIKFAEESSIDFRLDQFNKFTKTKNELSDLNTEIILLKERQVTASSFAVMEQQIFRTKALRYRKQAAEMFTNTQDEKLKNIVQQTGAAFSQSFTELAKSGYGIPFADEIMGREELAAKLENGTEAMARIESSLREMMPNEFATLEKIAGNVKMFNQYSLAIRKEFSSKLDLYVGQILKNLTREDYSREIMVNAANGDQKSLNRIRELLGKDLVTDKEILDSKLKKLIQELV
ncbi:MAG: DUF4105 domain-containing protein [Bacteriovorax sp.]|nr:DUF4105 domain-containing protein [Bacteriovorax sp.]